jgi:hypothetical protein
VDLAQQLGVFSDRESEYCQDWDTVFRFTSAKHTPVHIPEVLYHWRAHEASSTHKADRVAGSLRSQRHVLERFVAGLQTDDLFNVREWPLHRGLPELWLSRSRRRPPSMHVIVFGDSGGGHTGDTSAAADWRQRTELTGYPFADFTLLADCGADRTRGRRTWSGDLRAAVARSGTELVTIIRAGLDPQGADWPWEAVGILELLPQTALVGGRVARNGHVVEGEILIAPDGRFRCPDEGREENDAGYYALSLKPHLTDAVTSSFLVMRTDRLAAALNEVPHGVTRQTLGVWLGVWAAHNGYTVAFSPLLTARDTRRLPGDAGSAPAVGGKAPWAAQKGEPPIGARWEWRMMCDRLGEGRPAPGP